MGNKINITLPDGSKREYDKGVSSHDIAMSISEGLARNVLSAKVNGEVWDSNRPINENATVQLLTWKDTGGKSTFWHSSAHLLTDVFLSFQLDFRKSEIFNYEIKSLHI